MLTLEMLTKLQNAYTHFLEMLISLAKLMPIILPHNAYMY